MSNKIPKKSSASDVFGLKEPEKVLYDPNPDSISKNTLGEFSRQEINVEGNWKDLSMHSTHPESDSVGLRRHVEDILTLNKVIGKYKTLAFEEKKHAQELPGLEVLEKMFRHLHMFEEKKFKWESIQDDLDEMLAMLGNIAHKLCTQLDREYLDHALLQRLFPVKIIEKYTSIGQRFYGSPVYNKALYIQTSLVELLIHHHLKADTRFHQKIQTSDLNFSDPIYRIRIRHTNRKDAQLNQKYQGSSFKVKKYLFDLFDLFYPNVTFRYIEAGQEMQKWTLQIMLTLFELGLWTTEDIPQLTSTLLQKLESLLVLEKVSYVDFEKGKLKEDQVSVRRLKNYFFDCKEIVVSICLQIVTLINDKSFEESHILFKTASKKVKGDPYDLREKACWSNAYFNNEDVSNIIHRILTTYILHFSENVAKNEREALFQSINDLLMIIMDMKNDFYYTASRAVTQKLIEYYHEGASIATVEFANMIKLELISCIDLLVSPKRDKDIGNTDTFVCNLLNKLLSELQGRKNSKEKTMFRFALGNQCVPQILFSLLTVIVGTNVGALSESMAVETLIEVCRGNELNQSLLLHNQSAVHWDHLFEKRRLAGFTVFSAVFEDDAHLLFVNKNTFRTFMAYFSRNMTDHWTLPPSEDGSSVESWFKTLLQQPELLEELLIFFLYCRMLHTLIKFRDTTYDEKFFSLTIQGMVATPFFKLLLPVILDQEFLPRGEASPRSGRERYLYSPKLEKSSLHDVSSLIQQTKQNPLSEGELRGYLFEVAMYAMVLMNDSCGGLYSHWFYREHVKDLLPTLLRRTEYLFTVPEFGLRYRGIVFNFYTLFAIFPGNGLLTQRIEAFPAEDLTEAKILDSHLTGEILKVYLDELEQASLVSEILENENESLDTINSAQMYYIKGVFTSLLRFTRGLYLNYSRAKGMDTLLTTLLALREKIVKMKPFFEGIIRLAMKPIEPGAISELISQDGSPRSENLRSKYLVTGSPDFYNRGKKRTSVDPQEYGFPKIASIRDSLESLQEAMTDIFENTQNDWIKIYYFKLLSSFKRETPILSKKDCVEPWNREYKDQILAPETVANTPAPKFADNLMLETFVIKTGMTSAEFRHFKELIDLYQTCKMKELSKPPNENILITFLQSKASNCSNIIDFVGRLAERLFEEVLLAPKGGVHAGSLQESANFDKAMIVFLENEILYSFIRFFSKILNGCDAIRTELYHSATRVVEENSSTTPGFNESAKTNNWTLSFLSLMAYIVTNTSQICMFKTFFDFDHSLLLDRQKHLTDFFKNLCENNYQQFKLYLGTEVPKVSGLPGFNSTGLTFLELFHHNMEDLWKVSKASFNRWGVMVVSDMPECFPVMMNLLKAVSEFTNGPCPQNQLRVYKSNTNAWFELIKRMIDNVDSSFYDMKLQLIDYLMALMEGDHLEILVYFGSNITFSAMFRIVTVHLKRLYIYILYRKSPASFESLVRAAREKKRVADLIRKEQLSKVYQQKLSVGEYDFYSMAGQFKRRELKRRSTLRAESLDGTYQEAGEEKDEKEEELDWFDPKIITDEVMDHFKVEKYTDILEAYLRDPEFSSHKVLTIALKLNELMVRFSSCIGGYKISLNNIYRGLIDLYGREVPHYIQTELGGRYQRKKAVAVDEKLILYMFIVKMTAELEVRNPKNQVTHKVQFPLVPKAFFLTAMTKSLFIRTADTESMVVDLMQNYQRFSIEMEDNLELHRKLPLLYKYTSDDAFHFFKKLLWTAGLTLNILLIIFFRRDSAGMHIIPAGNLAIVIIAWIIASFSAIFMTAWFLSRYRQKQYIVREELESEEARQFIRSSHVVFETKLFLRVVKSGYVVLFTTHVVANVLGIFIDPFFYTLQLLMIVFISETSMYVVRAFTTHFKQLALTIFLAVLLMYSYSVLSAGHFWENLEGNVNGISGTPVCQQLWECLIWHIDMGLRSGGGIGDHTQNLDPFKSESLYASKFFYDVIFFMLINVISLNIIFGIIIDTFAAMREANGQRNEALASACMVCNASKGDLEKQGKDFFKHIEYEHAIWSYFRYLVYLQQKNPEDFTGLESSIQDQFLSRHTDWIPYATEQSPPEKLAAETQAINSDPSISGRQRLTAERLASIEVEQARVATELANLQTTLPQNIGNLVSGVLGTHLSRFQHIDLNTK